MGKVVFLQRDPSIFRAGTTSAISTADSFSLQFSTWSYSFERDELFHPHFHVGTPKLCKVFEKISSDFFSESAELSFESAIFRPGQILGDTLRLWKIRHGIPVSILKPFTQFFVKASFYPQQDTKVFLFFLP